MYNYFYDLTFNAFTNRAFYLHHKKKRRRDMSEVPELFEGIIAQKKNDKDSKKNVYDCEGQSKVSKFKWHSYNKSIRFINATKWNATSRLSSANRRSKNSFSSHSVPGDRVCVCVWSIEICNKINWWCSTLILNRKCPLHFFPGPSENFAHSDSYKL